MGIADVALTRDNYLSKLEAIQQLGVGHRLLEARVSLMEKHFRGSCRKDRLKRRKPRSGAPRTPPTWDSTIYGWMLGLVMLVETKNASVNDRFFNYDFVLVHPTANPRFAANLADVVDAQSQARRRPLQHAPALLSLPCL